VSTSHSYVSNIHSACRNLCQNYSRVCGNCTLCVEIYLVRVEITFVHVVITLIRVKITLCLHKSLLCVFKSQSWVSQLDLCVSKSHCMWEITLCVKSLFSELNSQLWVSKSYCSLQYYCETLFEIHTLRASKIYSKSWLTFIDWRESHH
jgi:hypothetical protein